MKFIQAKVAGVISQIVLNITMITRSLLFEKKNNSNWGANEFIIN